LALRAYGPADPSPASLRTSDLLTTAPADRDTCRLRPDSDSFLTSRDPVRLASESRWSGWLHLFD